MSKKINERINGCSFWVLLYGIFVGVSIVLQCAIPAVSLYAELTGYSGFFTTVLNSNFTLPMDMIILVWTIMVPLYIGVDRATAFMFITKEGKNNVTVGHPERLLQIVIQSFFLYSLAVVLSLIFDRDLQLGQLAASFGLGVLLYVTGKKSNALAETLVEDEDEDGLDDELAELLKELNRRKDYLANGGHKVDINKDGIDDMISKLETMVVKRKQQLGLEVRTR